MIGRNYQLGIGKDQIHFHFSVCFSVLLYLSLFLPFSVLVFLLRNDYKSFFLPEKDCRIGGANRSLCLTGD